MNSTTHNKFCRIFTFAMTLNAIAAACVTGSLIATQDYSRAGIAATACIVSVLLSEGFRQIHETYHRDTV